MATELTVRTVNDDAVWDAFNADSPQGSVFTSASWVKAACDAQGASPCFLGVFDRDRLSSALSYAEIVRGPFRKASTPVLTPYGGLLYRPVPGKRQSESDGYNLSCAELLADRLTGRYGHTMLVHHPAMTDIRAFSWTGWKDSVRYTYRIDITDADQVWDLMERRVRTVIRRAEESLELGGPVDTGQFIDLYTRIYRDRGGTPPVATAIVRALFERVMAMPGADMRSVRDGDGKVVSTMILLSDRRAVHSWLSGSLPGENGSGAFSLLFWDAVRRYSGRCTHLDMIGANLESIAFFKKGFGGLLTPYYVTERYASSFTRMLFGLYTRMTRG